MIATFAAVVFVPALGVGAVTGRDYFAAAGGLPNIHPATWLVMGAAAATALRWPKSISQVLTGRVAVAYIGVACYLVLALLGQRYAARTAGANGQLLDEVVGPATLAFLVLVSAKTDRRGSEPLAIAAIRIGMAEAALILAEKLAGHDLAYSGAIRANQARQFLAAAHEAYRPSGTFDHPLIAGTYLAATLTLVLTTNDAGRSSWRLLKIALLASAIVTTGSRSATIAVLVVVPVLGLRVRSGERARTAVPAALGLVAAAALASELGMLGGLAARFSSGSASAQVRVQALHYFVENVNQFWFAGNGVGSSFTLSASLFGQVTSFENPFIMLVFDSGLVAALALMGSMLLLIRGNSRERGRLTAMLPGIVTLALCLTFSSFATKGVSGYILWFMLAICSVSRLENCSARTDSTMSAGARSEQAQGARSV